MHAITFFKEFLRDSRVAAVLPSSGRVIGRVLRHVPTEAATVLELGPGTGALTFPLLSRMGGEGRYVAVERNRTFFTNLAEVPDPRLTTLNGDARDVRERLDGLGLRGSCDLVAASIPFTRLDRGERRRVAETMHDALRPGGVCIVFHQYTTVMRGPLRRTFGNVRTEFEPLNVFPCFVMIAERR